MDVYNGSSTQLRSFQQRTGISYPLALVAGDLQTPYGVFNDWSVVVDQQGFIRYKQPGVNVNAINSVIDNLLAMTGVEEQPATVRDFELQQNFPNPFNPATRIAFSIPSTQKVSLQIYDAQGKLVQTLLNKPMAAGRHEAEWNGLNRQNEAAASGVYFYLLQSGSFREMKKMILLR